MDTEETLYVLYIAEGDDMSDELKMMLQNRYSQIMDRTAMIDVISAYQLGELPNYVETLPIFEIETFEERYILDTCEDILAWCEANIDKFLSGEKIHKPATVRRPGENRVRHSGKHSSVGKKRINFDPKVFTREWAEGNKARAQEMLTVKVTKEGASRSDSRRREKEFARERNRIIKRQAQGY